MAIYDAQQPSDPQAGSGNYVADQDEQARKRTAIGLSPHRPTAPNAVQRPPDAGLNISGWWLVFCLVLLIVAVGMVLAGSIAGLAGLWPKFDVPNVVLNESGPIPTVDPFTPLPPAPGFDLWLADDFSVAGVHLQDYDQPGQVSARTMTGQGVYRIVAEPGHIGWNLFDLSALPAYQLESSATLDAPETSAGLIGRFADTGNFYLFTIDGKGQYAVKYWKSGDFQDLQAATWTSAIGAAGQANRLSLADDGTHLRFYANGSLLYEVAEPEFPPGRAGIAALSTGEQPATVDFDWLAIYTSSG